MMMSIGQAMDRYIP